MSILSIAECPEFPCEILSNMRMDRGFYPLPKIETCKKWASENLVIEKQLPYSCTSWSRSLS